MRYQHREFGWYFQELLWNFHKQAMGWQIDAFSVLSIDLKLEMAWKGVPELAQIKLEFTKLRTLQKPTHFNSSNFPSLSVNRLPELLRNWQKHSAFSSAAGEPKLLPLYLFSLPATSNKLRFYLTECTLCLTPAQYTPRLVLGQH